MAITLSMQWGMLQLLEGLEQKCVEPYGIPPMMRLVGLHPKFGLDIV